MGKSKTKKKRRGVVIEEEKTSLSDEYDKWVESDSKTMEVEEDSVYQEDTDVLLESIKKSIRPASLIYFRNLRVIGIDNQEITLYESNKVIIDFLIMRYKEFLSEISGEKVVNIVGVKEKEKNLNIRQPSFRIGPDF